jgi:hypothetical protein
MQTNNTKKDYHKIMVLQIPESLNCNNLHCKEHSDMVSSYTIGLLEAVEDAAGESLPVVGGGGSKAQQNTQNWNEYVKPYYEESKFWHNIWESSGKPTAGQLLKLMRESKHQYKYALRRVQRGSNTIQKDNFVSAILKGGTNIFDEIKKHRGKVNKCSSTIDGEVGSANIANHFAGIYKKLYNQVEQGDKITDIMDGLNKKITNSDLSEISRVTESVIRQGLKRMKGNKSDAIFDFRSDCLIDGPLEIVTHLTNMIRMFISHGQVSDIILVCTLLPLVKDNLADLTLSETTEQLLLDAKSLNCLTLSF